MEDKTLPNFISQLIAGGVDLDKDDAGPEGQDDVLLHSLKALAGESGGAVEQEIGAFLRGEGALLETTRTALTRGRSSAVKDVAEFLERQFNLSAPMASVAASILVKVFPSIGKLAGEASPEKPKPRRKRKTESSSKPRPSSSSKPKKPKSASSAKPASSSKPKKPKTSSSSKPATKPKKPKTSTSKPARKKTQKSEEIPLDD